MKKGYHSTQSKAFNTIPRSEYLGVVLGFAIGMFLTGALHWDNRILELIGAVAGFAVGWWIDGKYYAEKDIPAGSRANNAGITIKLYHCMGDNHPVS